MSTKNILLSYLKQAKGQWISGETLSRKLAITRTAVWKHISKLKSEGYVIESSPKKGYLFHRIADFLTASEIREGLNTEIFGKREIIYFKETDSTNIQGRELAAQNAPEGTMIISEEQRAGRGRRGRKWFSPAEGGIYTSIILKPRISPVEAPIITLMTALAAAETLQMLTALNVRIKWPNDIMINDKKIGGILTEISTEMDAVNYGIVGLGLNINIPSAHFPTEIRGAATSVLAETGREFSRIALLQCYLERCEKHYMALQQHDFQPILQGWRVYENVIGRNISVQLTNICHTGRVLDIESDGALIIENNQGNKQKIFSGDIIFTDI